MSSDDLLNLLTPPDNRSSLGSTFKRAIRRIILPSNAAPLDDAIILDSNVPGCLGQRYKSVIIFRQKSPQFRMQRFIGVVRSDIGALPDSTTTYIEEGYTLIDDSVPTCWIYVNKRYVSEAGPGNTFQQALEGNLLIIGGPPVNLTYLNSFQGDVNIWGLITWGQAISSTVQDRQTASYTSASTTYTATGAVFCGVIFIAPPSGNMLVHFGGRKNNNTAGTPSNYLAITLKTGNSIGSGTTVSGPGDTIADDSASTNASFNGGNSVLFTGLTVGAFYNAYLQHRVQTGTGTFSNRYVIAVPAL